MDRVVYLRKYTYIQAEKPVFYVDFNLRSAVLCVFGLVISLWYQMDVEYRIGYGHHIYWFSLRIIVKRMIANFKNLVR